jgi:hypothetical protein
VAAGCNKQPQANLPAGDQAVKNSIYNEFKDLANWAVTDDTTEWQLSDLDQSKLQEFPKGRIFKMSKSFNEAGFEGNNIDEQIQKAEAEQNLLDNAVRNTLLNNGWKFVAGPNEDGFYHDYLYSKDGHPLIFQSGTRSAVKGGMYVMVQFQY